MIKYATTRAEKTYIKKIVDENTLHRLTTAKLMGLPFKEIDPEKDQRWNFKKINSELLQAFDNGETITQMSERLERVSSMNEVAAIRNARTMTTSFENLGRLDGMGKMKENGTILKKQWLATISTKKHKTRDWHKELSGQTAEIDEPFINHPPSGKKKVEEKIMYPGDPNASAANIYNCRCTLTTVIEGFKPTVQNGAITNVGDNDNVKQQFETIKAQAEKIEKAYDVWAKYRQGVYEADNAEWGDGVDWVRPKKPNTPTGQELAKKYPAGAVYLRAETYANRMGYSNIAAYERQIGEKAKEMLKKGVNYKRVDRYITKAIKNVPKEYSGFYD